MELLLWLFSYDPRWFFYSKISLKTFKYFWFIPLLCHFVFVSYCGYVSIIYKFSNKNNPIIIDDIFSECENFLKLWIYSRICFSFLISLALLLYQTKISNLENKEKSFFNDAESIFPILNKNSNNLDYWLIRKSIMSTVGKTILILGIISFLWSCAMLNFHYLENKFQGCEYDIIVTINFVSILIFIGNIPMLVLLFFIIILKVNAFFCAYLSPKLLRWVSAKYTRSLVKFEIQNLKEDSKLV